MILVPCLLLSLFIVGLLYHQIPLWAWTVLITVMLAAIQFFALLSPLLLLFAWAAWLLWVTVLQCRFMRRRIISARLFSPLKKQLPALSQTEAEALHAGDIWWEAELFRGTPDWQQLHNIPITALSADEKSFLAHQVEHLCRMIDDWQTVHSAKDLPDVVWDYIRQERFWAMIIPQEYGGLGFSALAHSEVVAKIATRSVSAAVTVMVPNSLGPAELLLKYGTEQQKNYYLPALAKGEEVPCFALTSPVAGSDAGAITDTGVVCHGEFEGKTIVGIKLNWNKRYITLAPVATVMGLAFKLHDPEGLLDVQPTGDITVCLMPCSTPGIVRDKRHFPVGSAFMNGPIQGHDVFIPLDWIVGGVANAGRGWRMLMECLAAGRAISLPAMSLAVAQMSYLSCSAYARVRRQFNQPIGYFEGVAQVLARIGGTAYLLEATRLMTASAVDQHMKPAIASAIAKYYMTEFARQTVNDAMDIHGGKGIMMGPKNYLASAYQTLPISITVEGANILTRSLIIFGQGAVRCHPHVIHEITALNDPDLEKARRTFDQQLFAHMGYTLSKCVRSVVLAWWPTCLRWPNKRPLACYEHQLTRLSAAFAMLSDIALILLGGALKRKEALSGRLADVLGYLYMGSAVLKYYSYQGEQAHDTVFASWCLKTCLHRSEEALFAFIDNFPIRGLRMVLRALVFPLGRRCKLPDDQLVQSLATFMMQPSEFRERITASCFLGEGQGYPLAELEQAFYQAVAVDGIQKKLRQAKRDGKLSTNEDLESQYQKAVAAGILTEEELVSLREHDRLCDSVVQVDAF